MTLKHKAKGIEEASRQERPTSSNTGTDFGAAEDRSWVKIPLPSIEDPTNHHVMNKPKTLLDCCLCAQAFIDEHDLGNGLDTRELFRPSH